MNFSRDINENYKKLYGILKSDDVVFNRFFVKGTPFCLVFVKDLTNKDAIGKLILSPLNDYGGKPDADKLFSVFVSPEKERQKDVNKTAEKIVSGSTALLVDGIDEVFTFDLMKFEKRSIAEPPTSTVIKGPREGFVESLPVNISLMRRKLKSPDLKFEFVSVGNYSNTQIAICYIKGIAKKSLVNNVRKKLKKINIDAVLDSSYVSKFLGEHRRSVFKQVGNTEKPDILSAKILEGRIAVFVDGSPIALTVPYLLVEDFQSPSDYYSSSYSATVARTIRLISVLLSLLLPAVFVSSELFHLQFIPLSFLLTVENSIKGISLSPSYEMFFTLLIFEILNEASIRMPKYVGMVVSIVGGLVLGETAVNAGIISAPTLMIVAFSGICLYTVPELVQSFSIIRLLFLIVAGSLGGYGLIVVSTMFTVYLVSFESYDTPLCAPFSPLVTKDLKDSIYKGFFIEQKSRPLSLNNYNVTRIKRSKGEK